MYNLPLFTFGFEFLLEYLSTHCQGGRAFIGKRNLSCKWSKPRRGKGSPSNKKQGVRSSLSAATLCFAATILCFDSDALSAVVSLRPWHFFLLNYGTLVTRGRDRTFFSRGQHLPSKLWGPPRHIGTSRRECGGVLMHYFMGGILNRKGVKVVVGGISLHFPNVCRRYLWSQHPPIS